MKRNYLTLGIGLFVLLVFGLLLVCFQVRQTEVALVTTFGRPSASLVEPGLYFKWPWPIQRVQKFDKRIQNFQDRATETSTRDGKNVIVQVYVGWTISDPELFRERFDGSLLQAERFLEGLVSDAKNTVIGLHPFSDLISTDPQELKFAEIEEDIQARISNQAEERYGLTINLLGIKVLNLPESITENVFERMRKERERFVVEIRAEGERRASDIRSEAERDRENLLATARAEATRIRGQADAEADQYYKVFSQNPELAILLLKVNALESSLKERSTLILDRRTPPFDLIEVPDSLQASPAPAIQAGGE
ncbi:MAG TPA: protease modulator HflC [Methylomirabilota bacterium]|nr:protease modulator HflC [Methylomirabilota bacterium]